MRDKDEQRRIERETARSETENKEQGMKRKVDCEKGRNKRQRGIKMYEKGIPLRRRGNRWTGVEPEAEREDRKRQINNKQ